MDVMSQQESEVRSIGDSRSKSQRNQSGKTHIQNEVNETPYTLNVTSRSNGR